MALSVPLRGSRREPPVAQFLVVRPLAPPQHCASANNTGNKVTKEIINEVFPALVAIGAGLFGALFVGYVNHLLTKDRDRVAGISTRRRGFLVSMQAWRGEITRPYSGADAIFQPKSVFLNGLVAFRAEAEMIRKDFTGCSRRRFIGLMDAVSECKASTKDEILKSVDDIISYVDAA